jgi:hypothetical protein
MIYRYPLMNERLPAYIFGTQSLNWFSRKDMFVIFVFAHRRFNYVSCSLDALACNSHFNYAV